jgi:CRISPR-associated protein Csb2
MFRWRWSGGVRAPLPLTIPVALAARAGLMASLNRSGVDRLPDAFHHSVAGGHSAFWLPEDADGDGMIDHVSCLYGLGLPNQLLQGFAAGADISVSHGHFFGRLEPDWMGRILPDGRFGPSTVWLSATPYVTPRSTQVAKGKGASRDLPQQAIRDLRRAGLPTPFDVVCLPAPPSAPSVAAKDFVAAAGDRLPPGPLRATAFVQLVFDVPVMGPLLLGAGAHLGLGRFVPIGA